MKRILQTAVLAAGLSRICLAARCTTVMDREAMAAYENYVAAAEQGMPARFATGDLQWIPAAARRDAEAKLRAGKLVRWNLSDPEVNQKLAARNGTILHWIGAIRIPQGGMTELCGVLDDFPGYPRIYSPMIFEFRAAPRTGRGDMRYDVVLGLHQAFRFASVFLQHYAFRLKGQMDRSDTASGLNARLTTEEIRESDSGVPGTDDLLEPYHDHGIMWALNAWWRARPWGPDLYLEFETISLARSVQSFACRIGFVPIPRSIISSAMDNHYDEPARLDRQLRFASCLADCLPIFALNYRRNFELLGVVATEMERAVQAAAAVPY